MAAQQCNVAGGWHLAHLSVKVSTTQTEMMLTTPSVHAASPLSTCSPTDSSALLDNWQCKAANYPPGWMPCLAPSADTSAQPPSASTLQRGNSVTSHANATGCIPAIAVLSSGD